VLRQRVRSALCVPCSPPTASRWAPLYVDRGIRSGQFARRSRFLTAFGGLAAAVAGELRAWPSAVRREAIARENFARYFAPGRRRAHRALVGAGAPGRRAAHGVGAVRRPARFTRLAAGLAPDDLAATLSDFLSAMVECVFRHGGTLDKFIGDCVMAQWGAPERTADDADRALRAALDMLVALEVLNAARRTAGRPVLGMGVGVAHGEVFAGNIGSERRLEFTVIGDVVNQASRLCDAAAAGELLLSDALRLALRGPAPHLRAVIPPPALPGYANPPAVWSLTLATAYTG
jgi:adenylate cyclase